MKEATINDGSKHDCTNANQYISAQSMWCSLAHNLFDNVLSQTAFLCGVPHSAEERRSCKTPFCTFAGRLETASCRK